MQANLTDVQHVHILLFTGQSALCVHIADVLAAELACRYKMSSQHHSTAVCPSLVFQCRQEAAAAGTKRPRPQEPEPVNASGTAQTAEAPTEAPAVAMAADAATMTDPADTAAMAAAVAVNQRADAVLHNVNYKD